MTRLLVLLSLLFCKYVLAFSSFGRTVPNAKRVRFNGQTVRGLGHPFNAGSTSVSLANPFGRAFNDAVRAGSLDTAWFEICDLDSDGDGRTNGEELCDPTCVAPPGSTPECAPDIILTHPGFPDALPTDAPTNVPTEIPTESPTIDDGGTEFPTTSPTFSPTAAPTNETRSPTFEPTESPTEEVTETPTFNPTPFPQDDVNENAGAGDDPLFEDDADLALFGTIAALCGFLMLFTVLFKFNEENNAVKRGRTLSSLK